MNKHIYTVGSFTLALAMGGMPAMALAQGGVGAQIDAQAQTTSVSADATVRTGEFRDEENKVERQEDRPKVANLEDQNNESVGDDQDEQDDVELDEQDDIELELEDDGDVASSLDDLKQKIEDRKQELDDEEASTTPKFKNAMRGANGMRLAVHSFLASKDLLGGIGGQVSEIAREMNHSVSSTTNAEVKIHSRGFLTHFFFGGDKTSAEIIAQEAAKNQQRITNLTALLGQSNVPADIQVILQAQITALQTAQARLQTLAEKEQKAWGLFSWRF